MGFRKPPYFYSWLLVKRHRSEAAEWKRFRGPDIRAGVPHSFWNISNPCVPNLEVLKPYQRACMKISLCN